MKVLITGASGYVGSRLRQYLLDGGHDVRLLVRRGSLPKVAGTSGFDVVEGDIFNSNACLRACDGCDAVVHLVGIIREFPVEGITFDELHRGATHYIVDAARRSGVERFIHMSALGAREDAPARYHRTKYAGEQVVKNSPLRWTVFRPSWVFSPGDQLSQEIKNLIDMPIVPLINGGSQQMQPVSLEDVCTCMAKSLSQPETQEKTYEMGGPDRVSFKDIVLKAAAHLGRKPNTVSVPAWAVRPAVRFLQRYPSFPLTVDQLRMLSEDNTCEVDPYVKAFQIEPMSFLAALPALFGRENPEAGASMAA